MKPKRVATQNAGKYNAIIKFAKFSCTVLLLCFSFISISCDNSDDLDKIRNESPTEKSNIIYTNIEPDFTSENQTNSYNLDLNNDQVDDFILSLETDGGWEYLSITSNATLQNGIISVNPWYAHPVPLNNGKEIFNLRGYRNGESYETWGIFAIEICHGGEQDCFYSWNDKVDKYLGLRFQINGQSHYGWARLNVGSPTQWVIKEYAYNATANKPILAGQMD